VIGFTLECNTLDRNVVRSDPGDERQSALKLAAKEFPLNLPGSQLFGFGTAAAGDVVSIGRRLTKDVYAVYEHGLADAEGALRVTWQITRAFQLLVRAGYLPGVDAVYRWTFE